ncbi:MAG: NAD-dependent epimerase/dehydratase family protein [Anaerolineales bacterium]
MRALVTGATGCVGANIVEALLAEGWEVRALQRPTSSLQALRGLEPEMVVGDILDYDSLLRAMAGCEWVFHAAAISQYWRSDMDLLYRVNVEGTRNVMRAAQEQGVERVIYTSSVAALGVAESGTRIDETSTFNLPFDRFPYGHSKVLAEAEVQRAVRAGLDVVTVNPVTVIGQRDVGFVGGEFLRVACKGQAVVVPPGGVGIVSARRVGAGHLLAARQGGTGERYILNGENVRYRRLMRVVARVVGVRPPRVTLPRPSMGLLAAVVDALNRARGGIPLIDGNQVRLSARLLYYDGSKAQEELGFSGGTLEEAVEEAWRWYQEEGLL